MVRKAVNKKPERDKEGIMTSGHTVPKFQNMRRSELAKLVKDSSKKTKDQLIAELS